MSNTIAYVDNQTLTNIANAVRYKTGTNGKMLLSDIPDKIRNIEGIVPIGTQTITENGVYDVTEKAEVDVNVNPDLRPLSVSENGQYSPDGFDGYSGVSVDVPQKITFESFTLGNYPFGDVKIDPSITDLRTRMPNQLGITSIDFQNVERTNGDAALFYGCTNLRTIYAPKMYLAGNSLFQNCYALYEDGTINLAEIMPVATTMYSWVFRGCRFAKAILPTTLTATYSRTFGEASRMHTVYFTGTPIHDTINATTFDATVIDIYVPWPEGAISKAPWGATNATIHYNTVYDEEWNVISST